ncbi:MAG: hypothetical protein HY974_03715 [Candidatus Kerfeldbacteria bacterium]|nr:hypothetical protein [Candidatus Kerfeldbacteria bacterium]
MAFTGQSRSSSYAPRHQVMLIIGTVVAVLVLGWLLALRPLWSDLRALPDQEVLKVATQMLETELKNLSTISQQYSELSSRDLARLDLVLPRGQDLPTLIAQFDGLAKASTLALDGLNLVGGTEVEVSRLIRNEAGEVVGVQESRGGGGAMEEVRDLQVNISLAGGSYQGLKQFIASSAEAVRWLNLTSLTFITGGQETTYNLSFRTAYLP